MKLAEYNAIAEQLDEAAADDAAPAIRKRGAILTVHGINTNGQWMDDLSAWIQDAGFRYSRVTYGKILLRSALPAVMDDVLKIMERRYNEQRRRRLDVSIIAHSYGSLATGLLLWRKPTVVLRRVVLYGSILSRRYPWAERFANGQIQDVLHEVGGSDIWPWFAPFFFRLHRQVGWSGVLGFRNRSEQIFECHHPGVRHSDLQSEEHFKRAWIPFIADGPSAIQSVLKRRDQ